MECTKRFLAMACAMLCTAQVAFARGEVVVVAGNAGLLKTPIRADVVVDMENTKVVEYKRGKMTNEKGEIPLKDYLEEKQGGDLYWEDRMHKIEKDAKLHLFNDLQRHGGLVVFESNDGRHVNNFHPIANTTHE